MAERLRPVGCLRQHQLVTDARRLVDKLWSYCHVLRDDGVGVLEYTEQLTYLLFLKDGA